MYLVYGAGNTGKNFLICCKEKGIKEIILVDSNHLLWGKKIEGFEVLNPNKIDYREIKLAIISTAEIYYEEIKDILIARGFEGEIAYYNNILLFSSDDILNLGNVKLKKEVICPGIYTEQKLIQYFDENSFNDLDKFFYHKEHRLIHKWVHYTEAYDRFFSKYRGKKVTLLEIGVYQGGSLQMWKDYFGENAEIIGLDINPDCKKAEGKNIKIYIGDQEDRKFLNSLKKQIGRVDIIIDDGGHMMEQQKVSFEELFDVLADDGIYLCEDCHTSYWRAFNGGYRKKNTFIEFSKSMIDGLNVQYIEEDSVEFQYSSEIKSLSFYDGMVFIEKRSKANKSLAIKVGL